MILYNFLISVWLSIFVIKTIHGTTDFQFGIVKSLEYLFENSKIVTPDAVLGVAFAEGQLMEILERGKIPLRIKMELEKLIDLCRIVRESHKSFNDFPTVYNSLVSRGLTHPDVWNNRDFQFQSKQLHSGSYRIDSLDDYLKIVDVGSPNELESDQCLSQILNSTCHLSRKCWDLMSWKNDSFGYHLTHKLIFFTILQRDCSSIIPHAISEENVIAYCCSKILIESNFIASLNYPQFLRDLFMEQVLLCGYHGFTEFLTQTWLTNIASWQNTDGCFKYQGIDTIYGNCSNHMTGLGIASLALFGKVILM